MSRQLEQEFEERARRQHNLVLHAVYGGLEKAVQANGGELHGFSVKLNGGDCLITLRAVFPEGGLITFVGAEDLPAALRKAVKEGHRDTLGWREDRYAK